MLSIYASYLSLSARSSEAIWRELLREQIGWFIDLLAPQADDGRAGCFGTLSLDALRTDFTGLSALVCFGNGFISMFISLYYSSICLGFCCFSWDDGLDSTLGFGTASCFGSWAHEGLLFETIDDLFWSIETEGLLLFLVTISSTSAPLPKEGGLWCLGCSVCF